MRVLGSGLAASGHWRCASGTGQSQLSGTVGAGCRSTAAVAAGHHARRPADVGRVRWTDRRRSGPDGRPRAHPRRPARPPRAPAQPRTRTPPAGSVGGLAGVVPDLLPNDGGGGSAAMNEVRGDAYVDSERSGGRSPKHAHNGQGHPRPHSTACGCVVTTTEWRLAAKVGAVTTADDTPSSDQARRYMQLGHLRLPGAVSPARARFGVRRTPELGCFPVVVAAEQIEAYDRDRAPARGGRST